MDNIVHEFNKYNNLLKGFLHFFNSSDLINLINKFDKNNILDLDTKFNSEDNFKNYLKTLAKKGKYRIFEDIINNKDYKEIKFKNLEEFFDRILKLHYKKLVILYNKLNNKINSHDNTHDYIHDKYDKISHIADIENLINDINHLSDIINNLIKNIE